MNICNNRDANNPHYLKTVNGKEFCCGELRWDIFQNGKTYSDFELISLANNSEIPECRGWWDTYATSVDINALKTLMFLKKDIPEPQITLQPSGVILSCNKNMLPQILTYHDGSKEISNIICSGVTEEIKGFDIKKIDGGNKNI